jgi:hypothetical protein
MPCDAIRVSDTLVYAPLLLQSCHIHNGIMLVAAPSVWVTHQAIPEHYLMMNVFVILDLWNLMMLMERY